MSLPLRKLCLLSAACFALGACTGTNNGESLANIALPLSTSLWEAPLPTDQGSLTITFTLPQYAIAEFQLLKGKPQRANRPVARITLSNENCTAGHSVAVNVFANAVERIQYFDKEVLWNKPNTLTLSWDKQHQLTTMLNGDAVDSALGRTPDRLLITSILGPIQIQQIEFTANKK